MMVKSYKKKKVILGVPGSLVVKILGLHCHNLGSIPGWGTEILEVAWHEQKKKKDFFSISF